MCGLPTVSKKILTAKDVSASRPAPGTPMYNNLTSPGARGSFGTVAQEEITDKTTPLIKTLICIDFKITNLLPILAPLFLSSYPDPSPSPSPKTPHW
jgi:hypothetical protein